MSMLEAKSDLVMGTGAPESSSERWRAWLGETSREEVARSRERVADYFIKNILL